MLSQSIVSTQILNLLKRHKIIFSLFCLLLLAQQTVFADKLLYVFYPTDIRPKKMEKHITQHCPEIDITVFGKIKDFEEQTKRTYPDAILSYAPVIKKNHQYSLFVQGLKQGSSKENYVLVSIDKPVEIQQLSSLKVGVLDILGRKAMKSFINTTLGTKVKIARVTKTEDILNLLTFGMVDTLFVSQQRYEKFREKSQLNLIATKLNIKMDLAILAVKNNESKDIFLNCFNRLGKQTNMLLGVDQWALIQRQTNAFLEEILWVLK
jgi:hypothetical protein